MTFWDTALGHHLAEVLIRNLPGIKESLSAISTPRKRTQHAKVIQSHQVENYLNEEFEKGHVFVNATPFEVDCDNEIVKFLVITE